MYKIIYLISALLTIALTPGIIIHTANSIPYESNLSITAAEQTDRVYIIGSIYLLECDNITDIGNIYVNNINITLISKLSGAIRSDKCTIIIDTSRLGLYGMIKNGDTIGISLSYTYHNNTYDNKLYIVYSRDNHNTSIYSSEDLASEFNRASNDMRMQVSSYYKSNNIVLDYKRHLTLFVLLALTIALLVREYDYRERG